MTLAKVKSKLCYFTFKALNSLGKYLKSSVTRKKSPNVYKSCPKMILLKKLQVFDTIAKIA